LILLGFGTGTGSTFQLYPPHCRLTCIDPDPNFSKFLLDSLSENRHLKPEHSAVTSGKDLCPIPGGSVDVAVCTSALCSVTNVKQVLTEVLGVLGLTRWGCADLCRDKPSSVY
ncbi:PREDICTED: methyltransferase-like protein 7A, partial [Eurypyga helias]|uniref:methyltransferase-like protein 7A n=1 Tax=Eurypyga helias TaxID=54383 RepID=UPI0005280B4F